MENLEFNVDPIAIFITCRSKTEIPFDKKTPNYIIFTHIFPRIKILPSRIYIPSNSISNDTRFDNERTVNNKFSNDEAWDSERRILLFRLYSETALPLLERTKLLSVFLPSLLNLSLGSSSIQHQASDLDISYSQTESQFAVIRSKSRAPRSSGCFRLKLPVGGQPVRPVCWWTGMQFNVYTRPSLLGVFSLVVAQKYAAVFERKETFLAKFNSLNFPGWISSSFFI